MLSKEESKELFDLIRAFGNKTFDYCMQGCVKGFQNPLTDSSFNERLKADNDLFNWISRHTENN